MAIPLPGYGCSLTLLWLAVPLPCYSCLFPYLAMAAPFPCYGCLFHYFTMAVPLPPPSPLSQELFNDFGCPEMVVPLTTPDPELKRLFGKALSEDWRQPQIARQNTATERFKSQLRSLWDEVDSSLHSGEETRSWSYLSSLSVTEAIPGLPSASHRWSRIHDMRFNSYSSITLTTHLPSSSDNRSKLIHRVPGR